jgi:hypothetical protein
MRVLKVADLLQIWESGVALTAVQRALLLLTAVFPDSATDELAQISIGQRNKQLLLLREALFGHSLESVVSCPQCNNRLELQFSTQDLLAQDVLPIAEPNQHSIVEVDEYQVQFRNPNSLDIATIPPEATMEEAQNHLLARCILEISNEANPVSLDNIPDTVVQQVVAMMAEKEPLADSYVVLHCPSCEHSWNAFFDIVSYLWTEIERWAAGILQEVHILASAYGWHEDDILDMSSWRRQLYLEKILN